MNQVMEDLKDREFRARLKLQTNFKQSSAEPIPLKSGCKNDPFKVKSKSQTK